MGDGVKTIEDTDQLIRVKRSSSIYNAHGYLTKVPEEAILPFLERYTQPGDLVVDPFAGSGMTGVAALLSGRRAKLSDISRLGQHIGQNYTRIVDAKRLLELSQTVTEYVTNRYAADYATTCSFCGQQGEIRRLVWSEIFECPVCHAEVNFYEAVFDPIRRVKHSTLKCPKGHSFVKRSSIRLGERPVEVHYTCVCSRNIIERLVQQADLDQIQAIEARPITHWWPDVAFAQDTEMFSRSALIKNERTRLGDFFSRRNLNALACLWEAIERISEGEYREKLRFAFTAILNRASKRYQWGPKRPLNAQNQTYYVAPVFYEWNVLDLYQRKVNAITDAMLALEPEKHVQPTLWSADGERPSLPASGRVEYILASAHDLAHLGDGTADYVFTDPPFGSNIFYSDMNYFAEAWLGEFTDPTHEAVVRTIDRSRKTLQEYRAFLGRAIKEIYRVLKPGAWASIIFSNSRGDVWSTFQRAIMEAGFIVADTRIDILDKGQRSVKGLASDYEHVVTVDLIVSLHKPVSVQVVQVPSLHPIPELTLLVERATNGIVAQSDTTIDSSVLSYTYLSVIRTCLQEGLDVEPVSMRNVAAVAAVSRPGYS